MTDTIKLLEVVALTEDLHQKHLLRGQVGTVVETLAEGVYEVEFSDDDGRTFATAALRESQLMPLRYRPASSRPIGARED